MSLLEFSNHTHVISVCIHQYNSYKWTKANIGNISTVWMAILIQCNCYIIDLFSWCIITHFSDAHNELRSAIFSALFITDFVIDELQLKWSIYSKHGINVIKRCTSKIIIGKNNVTLAIDYLQCHIHIMNVRTNQCNTYKWINANIWNHPLFENSNILIQI